MLKMYGYLYVWSSAWMFKYWQVNVLIQNWLNFYFIFFPNCHSFVIKQKVPALDFSFIVANILERASLLCQGYWYHNCKGGKVQDFFYYLWIEIIIMYFMRNKTLQSMGTLLQPSDIINRIASFKVLTSGYFLWTA